MLFTMRQRQLWTVAKTLLPVLAMGVLLGFAKPFSSNPPLSEPVRYAFWVGMVFLGYAAALAAKKLIPATSIPRPPLRLGAVAVASAAPLTFVTAWVIPFIRPDHPSYNLAQLPTLFCIVAAVQLAIVFVLMRSTATADRPAPPQPVNVSEQFPRTLLSRLPGRLGDKIVALEAEDHYLRVHTSLGSGLVLMRLSDAIAAIEPHLGLQVHRSWWVARDAICEIVRTEHRSHVRLSTGLVVPVGRTFLAAVRSQSARLLLLG